MSGMKPKHVSLPIKGGGGSKGAAQKGSHTPTEGGFASKGPKVHSVTKNNNASAKSSGAPAPGGKGSAYNLYKKYSF